MRFLTLLSPANSWVLTIPLDRLLCAMLRKLLLQRGGMF